MASPFAVFRRNQRILIAVSGIMAMIAFVFLDPVMRMLGGGNRALENPVMVKTNYGNFKRSELSAIEDQRRWLGFFLERIVQARVAKELEGKQIPPNSPYVRQYEMGLYQSIQQQLMARMMPAGDQAALETILLSKRAEEMGMVASDQAVTDYLRSISGDAFSQLRDIIAKLKPDGRIPISQGFLYDALRRELLASKYTQMFQLGMAGGMPPAERWEYYEQLHLEADAQVLPVKAEQFLKDVDSPGDEKLQCVFRTVSKSVSRAEFAGSRFQRTRQGRPSVFPGQRRRLHQAHQRRRDRRGNARILREVQRHSVSPVKFAGCERQRFFGRRWQNGRPPGFRRASARQAGAGVRR